MKAIGYATAGAIDRPDALVLRDVPDPVPAGHDLLVEVEAVALNPVDTKVRHNAPPDGGFRILGFDAVGTIVGAGDAVTLFGVGDRVFYAGSILRPGSNAELQLVDERIVGPAPKSLPAADAAALPLTAITAWEMLFDRFEVDRERPAGNRTILVIGGAGGVGSMAIQLAKYAGLNVVATASRPESSDWALRMGADHVIDHSKPLPAQWPALASDAPSFVFATTETERHFDDIVELIAPQGHLGVISGIGNSRADALSGKSIALHFELMFTRSSLLTSDMVEQHRLLVEVSRLVDAGTLKSTRTEHYGRITPENLIRAHAQLETGRTIGKIVLEGF